MNSPARAEALPPASSQRWVARILALLLGLGVLVGGALAVDEAGRRVPGKDAEELLVPMRQMSPGDVVVVGNSVADSALHVADLSAELGQRPVIDQMAHGTGPTTWYVLYTQHLLAMERPPALMVLLTNVGALARAVPLPDREYALELARRDDPALAELMGISTRRLAWERRLAARVRVRAALVNLLGFPMATALTEPTPLDRPGAGPVDQAIQETLGSNEGNRPTRVESLVDPTTRETRAQTYDELEPAFLRLLDAATGAGTRVILVLLPTRRQGPGLLTADIVTASVPRDVQVVDMTTAPFEWSIFYDQQHFSREAKARLSQMIAYDVSLMWMGRSRRTLMITDPLVP